MTRAWALVSKSGKVIIEAIGKSRTDARFEAWDYLSLRTKWAYDLRPGGMCSLQRFWKEANRRGWRIARVEIRELDPEQATD